MYRGKSNFAPNLALTRDWPQCLQSWMSSESVFRESLSAQTNIKQKINFAWVHIFSHILKTFEKSEKNIVCPSACVTWKEKCPMILPRCFWVCLEIWTGEGFSFITPFFQNISFKNGVEEKSFAQSYYTWRLRGRENLTYESICQQEIHITIQGKLWYIHSRRYKVFQMFVTFCTNHF